MALSCGIVGLPNVGKSTLFNCLTKAQAQAANYPFCTIEPNVGIVNVADHRLEKIADIINPEKIVPTNMTFVDIAGIVKGASKGEGLGNQFLSHIREVSAICHVVRCFEDSNITHVDGSINPISDVEIIETELLLADLQTVEKAIQKNNRMAKSGNKLEKKLLSFLLPLQEHLQESKPARSFNFDEKDEDLYNYHKSLHLLTAKPTLFIANVDEDGLNENNNKYLKELSELAKSRQDPIIAVCAKIEEEIATLDPSEQKEFLQELGVATSGLDRLIKAAFTLLGLSTYITAGVKEVRAWTINNNCKAPQAAGVIHTDFERGFIKASVIWWEDFIKYDGEVGCKNAGVVRLEGKDYLVKDGDIMNFKFNV